MDFFTSPLFLVVALFIAFLCAGVAILWKNTHWTARGITPAAMVAQLQGQGNLFSRRNLLIGLGVLGAVLLLALAFKVRSLEAPSLAATWAGMKYIGVWILAALAIFWVAAHFFEAIKPLQDAAGGAFVVLLIALLIAEQFPGFGSTSQKTVAAVTASAVRAPGDCTYTRPCDGSAEPVYPKQNDQACFDPPLGADPEGFGYRYTTVRGEERKYRCKPDELVNGTCREEPAQSFWFAPTRGQKPPRYWFINNGPSGSLTCP